MLLGGQTTELHMNAILPIASYIDGVGFRSSSLMGGCLFTQAHADHVICCRTKGHCILMKAKMYWQAEACVLVHRQESFINDMFYFTYKRERL